MIDDAELLAVQAQRIADLELDCRLLQIELRMLRLVLLPRPREPFHFHLPALLRRQAG